MSGGKDLIMVRLYRDVSSNPHNGSRTIVSCGIAKVAMKHYPERRTLL